MIGMRLVGMALFVWACTIMNPGPACAQVGGVRIDADGILDNGRSSGRSRIPDLPEEIARRSDLRQISLRAIEQQLTTYVESGSELPEELRLLAGLVAIDYIVIDPDAQDIRIAGPAEGWKVLADGREVGRSSGRATLHLEDLVTALRSIWAGRRAISCSIDPTPAGLVAVRKVDLNGFSSPREAKRIRQQLEEALGLQQTRTEGVPPTSRFARVMLEADYMMKSIAIGAVTVRGLPNHLDAVEESNRSGEVGEDLARWWFTANYRPISSNHERTVFHVDGPRIKLLNERMMVDADGRRHGTGEGVPTERFSAEFTEMFPSLETRFPVFSDLRNLYDLVLAAALSEERGADRWWEQSILLDEDRWPTPECVVPQNARSVSAISTKPRREGNARSVMLSVAFGGVSMIPRDMIVVDAGPAPSTGVPSTKPDDSEPDAKEDDAEVETTTSELLARPTTGWWTDVEPDDRP